MNGAPGISPPPTGNPSHLWQQKLPARSRLVAALTLDTFNRNADKLVMANIAQTVNVLQAMILTQGDKMLTTPTYHVFELYRSHQGARSVDCSFEANTISFAVGDEKRELPGLIGSASIKAGLLTLSVVNPHGTLPVEAALDLIDTQVSEANVATLTHADLTAHNTFEAPQNVRPVESNWTGTDRYTVFHTRLPVTVIRARMS